MTSQISSRPSDEMAVTGLESTRRRLLLSPRVLLVAADTSLSERLRALFRDDDRVTVVDAGGDVVRQAIHLQPCVLVLDVSGHAEPVGESSARLARSELPGGFTRTGAEAAPPGATRAAPNDRTEPGADTAHPVEPEALLTRREAQIVSAVVAACSNKDIAAQFAITETTVKHHLSNIFDKVGVSSRLELAMLAQHHGLGQTERTFRRRRRR
jgi:DNA-binding CsgD family transcriptional regulator